MKALCNNSKTKELYIADIPEPLVRDIDDVKIRVIYATIGPEEMWRNSSDNLYALDGVVGLEMVGQIVDLGPQAKNESFSVGDYVTGIPFYFCGTCNACRENRKNCCSNPTYNGGCMCEYILWKSQQLVRIEHLGLRESCLIASIAEALEVIERASISFHSNVLIWGGGYMAILLLQLFRKIGVQIPGVFNQLRPNRSLDTNFSVFSVIHEKLIKLHAFFHDPLKTPL